MWIRGRTLRPGNYSFLSNGFRLIFLVNTLTILNYYILQYWTCPNLKFCLTGRSDDDDEFQLDLTKGKHWMVSNAHLHSNRHICF